MVLLQVCGQHISNQLKMIKPIRSNTWYAKHKQQLNHHGIFIDQTSDPMPQAYRLQALVKTETYLLSMCTFDQLYGAIWSSCYSDLWWEDQPKLVKLRAKKALHQVSNHCPIDI